jgi:hypothetical protein
MEHKKTRKYDVGNPGSDFDRQIKKLEDIKRGNQKP